MGLANAVRVMQIATGEVEEKLRDPALEYARKGGLKGGKARAAKLNKQERTEIAKKAAEARWAAVTAPKSHTIVAPAPKIQKRKV